MSLCMHAQDSIGGSLRKTNSNFSPMKPSKSSLEVRHMKVILENVHKMNENENIYENCFLICCATLSSVEHLN